MAGDSSEDDGIAATALATIRTAVAGRESRTLQSFVAGTSIGRYVLHKRLGAGAMGVVWSARDPKLDRDVAIKLVHPELARSEHAATRLLREARAMAKLSHRSVITVHDAGDVDGQLWLAMELVRGTTLGHLLRSRAAAAIGDWPHWLAMTLDAGRGLAEAHRNGVLHRDFKPDNVMVDPAGRVCVGDFGLAMLGD
ncbi:MAG: serine/threonine protein kinase, partial [Deltaproteobacteria bacterium]|nr:serine/threonine protein kinase [Deltaproteobacteria bacterium]